MIVEIFQLYFAIKKIEFSWKHSSFRIWLLGLNVDSAIYKLYNLIFGC